MSEKNTLNLFEQLSTEILFEIFDYLKSDEILFTFFYLNQRFNSIVCQYFKFLTHFTTPINYLSFWQTFLPTIRLQIKCLTITTLDFPFTLDFFSNLQSLIISSPVPIFDDQLSLILENEQFKKLHSFKIKIKIISRNNTYVKPVLYQILQQENSLHRFESLSERDSSFANVNNPTFGSNLRSLSLKLSIIQSVFSLLNHTPNLKHFNLGLTALLLFNQSTPNIDLSHIKLERFSFVLYGNGIYQRNFPYLTWFIKQFSASLNYLSLNINKIFNQALTFNGFTLQQQLLESMIQLKSFHLYTLLDKEPSDVQSFLSTFQTSFWFDRQWTLGTHGIYLYTLPFHFNNLTDLIDFDKIQSSNTKILDSPKAWSHVKSIIPSTSSQLNVSILKQMKSKMPNLTSIKFDPNLINKLCTDDNGINQTDITLDSITTVFCYADYLRTNEHWLLKIFPNTRYLKLWYHAYSPTSSSKRKVSSEEVNESTDDNDDMYLSKVQYVKIHVRFDNFDHLYENVRCLVKDLLKMCPNLQSFILHFEHIKEFLRSDLFSDLDKMIEVLNMEKLSEKYQIKHIYNHLQYIRKDNQVK